MKVLVKGSISNTVKLLSKAKMLLKISSKTLKDALIFTKPTTKRRMDKLAKQALIRKFKMSKKEKKE